MARQTPSASPSCDTAAAVVPHRAPRQGAGVPVGPTPGGSAPNTERLNVAMRVLRDPAALESFARVYSGQARSWRR